MLDFSFLTLSLFFIFLFFFLSVVSHPPVKPKTPCPRSYPIIGNLFAFLRNRHRFHDWVTDMLSQTPSSTIQVNTFLNLTNGICTTNPTNIDHLLRSNFTNYVKGSRFQAIFWELLGDGIFSVDGHLWTMQRKIASYEFNTKSLKQFISETVSSEIHKSLLPYLSIVCDENRIVDFQDLLQKFTFNNICNVAFGVDAVSLNSDFFHAFDYAVENCLSRLLNPIPASWKMKRLFNIGSERRFKEAIKLVNDCATEIIKSKQIHQNTDGTQDLLSRFMAASSGSDSEIRHEEQSRFLRDIVISFILAGKDSTSTALTWFFWLINGHPRCASLIRDELSTVLEGGGSINLKYDELKKLHYLQAALSESMRLFPPVPHNGRLTADDDTLPDGTHVRKGWFADYSAYAMGRMEKVWGQDCREFKPERWLDGDGVFRPNDQFSYPVFHCGPRLCLGKEMAYGQMKSIVAAVMSEFEVIAVDGGATPEKMMNPPYKWSLLLKMRGGLPVRLTRFRARV